MSCFMSRFIAYVTCTGARVEFLQLSLCPKAGWEDIPSALVGSDGTIYTERETLRMQLNALLGE
jgi:hypothetical protein